MDRMKLLKLQIVIGIITSCIGIVTIMYGVNFTIIRAEGIL